MVSIIDQVAPHTRFYLGLDSIQGGKRVQTIQLLNRDDHAVLSVDVIDGKANADTFRGESRFDPHIPYFCDLAERYAENRPTAHIKSGHTSLCLVCLDPWPCALA